ncbi:MAG: glycosyltransferase family 2 protein [Candidatus Wolfebacteria bacterium]|nr:glycosyltransferase family 2 protein [Candidatus Wolfebacteria bacterium]
MSRFYEILPGLLAWITIFLIFFLSWLLPAYVSIFIIFFDIYWLFKTVYLSFHLRSTFNKMKRNLKIDWLEKLRTITNDDNNDNDSHSHGHNNHWSKIYHLVILPMYKESYEVVRESFESLAKSNYPKEKFIVILATEERAGSETQEKARKIAREFGSSFFKFAVTTHPANVPGEIPGKGSNQAYATKEIKKNIIDPLQIPYENILISVFDIDTQIPRDYFGRLTYVFLTAKHPEKSSYQPIPLFINNAYEAPALARVISFSSTFWQMMQQSRPERLTTFSSHSMPFKALVEIGFWNINVVSEDSRIFWQCYIHYGGDWRVEPLLYPVYMDAAVAPTFWGTMLNLYKQQRRWGWGCENIPYMFKGFQQSRRNVGTPTEASGKISLRKKIYWVFNTLEGFHSWATNAIMLFILGWLPILVGGNIFHATLLSYNLPRVTRWIMTLAMVGVVSSAILSIALLPPKPKWFKPWHYILYFFQWILMPVTLIIFGAIPGLEAQTRLMLGGKFRLGFWVTPKQRLTAKI